MTKLGKWLKDFQLCSKGSFLGIAVCYAVITFVDSNIVFADEVENSEQIIAMYKSKIINLIEQIDKNKQDCVNVLDEDRSPQDVSYAAIKSLLISGISANDIALKIETQYQSIKEEILEEGVNIQNNGQIQSHLLDLTNDYNDLKKTCDEADKIVKQFKQNYPKSSLADNDQDSSPVEVVANPFESDEVQSSVTTPSCTSEEIFLIQKISENHYAGRCHQQSEINADVATLQNSQSNMKNQSELHRQYYMLLANQIRTKWQAYCSLDLNANSCAKVPVILKQGHVY